MFADAGKENLVHFPVESSIFPKTKDIRNEKSQETEMQIPELSKNKIEIVKHPVFRSINVHELDKNEGQNRQHNKYSKELTKSDSTKSKFTGKIRIFHEVFSCPLLMIFILLFL